MANSLRQVPLTCSGHTRPVVDLAFAQRTGGSDDVLLISACKDGKPMLRDGVTGDWIGTFEGHKGAVWSVCLDGVGRVAGTGSADFTAKIWDTASGTEKLSLAHKHIVRAVELSPDGVHLTTGSADKIIRRFDISSAVNGGGDAPSDPLQTLEGHSGPVKYVRQMADGRRLLSVGDDRSIKVWDPTAGNEPLQSIDLAEQPNSLELTTAGDKFVTAIGQKVQIWSTDTFQVIKELSLPCPVYAASLHRDGGWVACGGNDFRLYKMDVETGAELESFKGHFGPVHCCAFSPDGQLYASGSEDGTVRLWQTVVGTTYGLWKFVEGAAAPQQPQPAPAAPPNGQQAAATDGGSDDQPMANGLQGVDGGGDKSETTNNNNDS